MTYRKLENRFDYHGNIVHQDDLVSVNYQFRPEGLQGVETLQFPGIFKGYDRNNRLVHFGVTDENILTQMLAQDKVRHHQLFRKGICRLQEDNIVELGILPFPTAKSSTESSSSK